MGDVIPLLAHRGEGVAIEGIHRFAREVYGGHLRPDANLAIAVSAPVRIDRSARSADDPLAGTVRVLQLLVSDPGESLLTALSPHVLPAHMGFPDELRADGASCFGDLHVEPLGLRLSELSGPVAALAVGSEPPMGAYSLFANGRRVWSACYRPLVQYTTWDGEELTREPMAVGDPPPPEGDHSDFPAHGISLLFREPPELTWTERIHLVASLQRATRPPSPDAAGFVLVEGGRFLVAPRAFTARDWSRYAHVWSE